MKNITRKCQNRTMESFAVEHVSNLSSKIILAEVAMSNFIAQHNLSFATADHLTDLPKMFPDSKIAAGYACKRTKTTAIVCDALQPHLLKPVVDTAKSLSFSILCDESNKRGDAEKLLTILVEYLKNPMVKSSPVNLETVGIVDLSADGIFSAIRDTLQQHGLSFQYISVLHQIYTCNVMKGARNGVVANLRQQQPKLVDIHCNCHILNLCVRAAVKTLPLKVDELLVDIFYHFHHSVKRVVYLQEYADFCNVQFKSVLSHSETRWLSLGCSVNRTLEMWDPLCSYFNSYPDVEKTGKVKTIASILNRPTTKVFLFFLSDMLAIFDKVNVSLQSSTASKVHFIQSEITLFLRRVLSCFVQPGEIRAADDLTKVEYSDPAKQVLDEDLFVGDRALAVLCHLADIEGEEPETKQAYDRIRNFHSAFVTKLLKTFPFSSKTLELLNFLDPEKVLTIPLRKVSELCNTFAVSSNQEAIPMEFREFLSDPAAIPTDDDADVVRYWLRIRSLKSSTCSLLYSNLATLAVLALQLLAIPVSNTDSERVFSLVRRIKTDFRASLSTSSLSSLIGCHFNKITCCEFTQFPDSFLQKAKTCTMECNRASATVAEHD